MLRVEEQKESISSILERTLDLIATECEENVQVSTRESAAKTLLNERLKNKRGMGHEDFVPFIPVKQQHSQSLFLDQISTSNLDAPKHWKTKKTSDEHARLFEIGSGKSTNQNRKKKSKHTKGEDYKGKFSEKVANRLAKQSKLSKLKSAY
jgi:hypothetical protein